MASVESRKFESEGPSNAGAQESSGKLFLGGLSWDTNEETLKEHFKKYGDIREAVVMRDRQTSRPRGFGFVTFEKAEVADAVVQETHILDGRQIDAKKSVPLEQKPKARKIFVGGLAPETTEEQFKQYFERFGEVAESQIMLDHMTGRSRGFGFVTFAEDAAAERVFAAGAMHDLKGKRVEVKPATPKGSTPSGAGASSGSTAPAGGTAGRGPSTGTGGGRPLIYPTPQPPPGLPYAVGHPAGAYTPAAYGMFGYAHPGTATLLPSGAAYGLPFHASPYVVVPYGAAPPAAGAGYLAHPGKPAGIAYPGVGARAGGALMHSAAGSRAAVRVAPPPPPAPAPRDEPGSAAASTPTSSSVVSDLQQLSLADGARSPGDPSSPAAVKPTDASN